ncbi:MAG: YicC family protein [Candidatus Omnitrophica bacterium]|nr:YicC family protein [Candidatus Omnitrophota bacterium]MDD5488330.1 YicC family protein [Candidatus Omnitrophota bacterium]
MIRSMTGFGKAVEDSPYGKIDVEIKTLNHKGLSITCNPVSGFFFLEEKVQKVFEGKIYRGKVFVKISRESTSKSKPLQSITVNENTAKEYLNKIRKAQKALGVGGELEIRDVLALPGVVEAASTKKEEKLWPYIEKALDKAIVHVVNYRKKEGQHLAVDFTGRLSSIEKSLKLIKKYEKQCASDYRGKLLKSIKKISGEAEFEKEKLENEVAAFAKNCDIAEEITRLNAHLKEYRQALKVVGTDAGKKLDFIAQEMQREANTIGAKSSDFRIATMVIDVKSEVERIREQIRNVE